MTDPAKTALHAQHLALGAKMVPFANWEMPLHYSQGVVQEHQTVRHRAGLFDVSHMGRIAVRGLGAEDFLDRLSTNRLSGKTDFTTTYTILTNEAGGSIDDTLVYRSNRTDFFLVANASNREKVVKHLQQEAHILVERAFDQEGILALQGPQSLEIASQIFPSLVSLKTHHFVSMHYRQHPLLVAATGYTGEKGYEFFVPHEVLGALWEELLARGAQPVGLGARDTLRLEMGFALYGHELSESIAPSESVAAWTIKWDKPNFVGKAALEALEKSPTKRHAYGIILLERGVAREGYEILQADEKIGLVTSGNFSLTLQKSIALILVSCPLAIGDRLYVQIRNQRVLAEVVSLPFIKI